MDGDELSSTPIKDQKSQYFQRYTSVIYLVQLQLSSTDFNGKRTFMLDPLLHCSSVYFSLSEIKSVCGCLCVCVRLMILPFTVMTVMITRVREHIWRLWITVQRWGQANGGGRWCVNNAAQRGEELPQLIYVQKRHDLPRMRGNSPSSYRQEDKQRPLPVFFFFPSIFSK